MSALDRLTVGHYTMRRQDLAADVALLERLGFRSISLARSKIEAFGMKQAAALLRASEIGVAHLSSYGRFGTTAASIRRGMDEVRRAVDWLYPLGGQVLVVISGSLDGAPWGDAARAYADAFAALEPEIRAAGVRLVAEVIHPLRRDLSFIHTLADARKLASGYVLDLWHSAWEATFLEQIRRDARRRIRAVQLSDWKPVTLRSLDRALLGEGILPLPAIVDALETGGYRGWYELEIVSDDVDAMGYEAVLAASRRAFERLLGG